MHGKKNLSAALKAFPAAVKTAKALGITGEEANRVASKIVLDFTGIDVSGVVADDPEQYWLTTETMAEAADLASDDLLDLLAEVGYVAKAEYGYRVAKDGLLSHRLVADDFTGEVSIEWHSRVMDDLCEDYGPRVSFMS